MAVVALNLGRDVSETTNGGASPAALELLAIRSLGMVSLQRPVRARGGNPVPAVKSE